MYIKVHQKVNAKIHIISKDIFQFLSIHTHTHTYIYIYISVQSNNIKLFLSLFSES